MAAWPAGAAPATIAPAGFGSASAPAGWSGVASLGWSLLSGSGTLSPEYQDLRGRLRLDSASWTARGLRLHLDVDGRHGLDERYAPEGVALGAVADSAGPRLRDRYRDRRQVRAAYLEVGDLAGGRLRAGRHQPGLQALGLSGTDGLSWTRGWPACTVDLTGGYAVPFWQPDAGRQTDARQVGAEVRLHPAAGWTAGAATARDESFTGRDRWRAGVDGRARLAETLWLDARAEFDAGRQQWLLGRVSASWRPRQPWTLRADAADLRTALFPAGDPRDSALYGGRTRELGLLAQRRWGGASLASLRIRSRYGARPLRSEDLLWRVGRFQDRDWGLSVSAGDSWSPWRRLERCGLALHSRLGRRGTAQAGVDADLFRWETSRAPAWRVRVRPRLGIQVRPVPAWAWDLQVEETVDEFQNLRTHLTSGLVYRW